MSTAAPLTTTSYAILGLLALRPWTTYELAQQMDRALGQFWPHARSKLYEEPKKLVARGLASATSEPVGKRPRTVYAITDKGRRALTEWVPLPSTGGPTLEFEQLVRVFFAEHGTREDLLAAIASARAWAEQRFQATADIPRGYLSGEGTFPERLPWLILVGRFLSDFVALVSDWSEWATETVEQWPEDIREATPDLATLERIAQRSDSYQPSG
ncbi:MAG: helix-turn-helix transcriptional regulator [Chloroflexota bacterium]